MDDKINIGISACLTGQNVRYDGGHALDKFLMKTQGRFVEYLPVCPEVECGLGVPREAMRPEGDPESPRLIVLKTRKDLTGKMIRWAQTRVAEFEKKELCGFIFKSRSPSRSTARKNSTVLQHMMGYFKRILSQDKKQELIETIDQYRNGLIPLIVPLTLLKHYVRKNKEPYLLKQTCLNPHPLELKLRNHV